MLSFLISLISLIFALQLAPPVAQAESLWPVNISDVYGSTLKALPDRSVYVGCGGGAEGLIDAKVFGVSGQLLTSLPQKSGTVRTETCTREPVLAEDGTLFAERFVENTSLGFIAFRRNTQLWPRPLDVKPLCGGSGTVQAATYVARRGLYLLVRQPHAPCFVGSGQSLLLRANKETGAIEQTIRVSYYGTLRARMTPYSQGIFIAGYGEHSYVDYSGKVATVPQEYERGLSASIPTVGYEGTRFVSFTSGPDPACGNAYSTKKVSVFSPAGKLWDFTLPSCVSPASVSLTPMPNGGVAVGYQLKGVFELQALNAAGRPLWSSPYRFPRTTRTGAEYNPLSDRVLADNNGLLVVQRRYWRANVGGGRYLAPTLSSLKWQVGNRLLNGWLSRRKMERLFLMV